MRSADGEDLMTLQLARKKPGCPALAEDAHSRVAYFTMGNNGSVAQSLSKFNETYITGLQVDTKNH